ncbi:MAG TPA: NUDIX hydrolase [Candidatus Hydrogenedentes bacterium]|nr:NUDIX hydrolase [Candidatus Hydrogenedentota bacterium]
MEKWLESSTMFQGRIFSVRAGNAELDSGVVAPREVVEHPGGVGLVPVLGDAVVLIRQYRIAVGEDVIEIPAGKLEPGDAPEQRARAELEEETGYRAGRMVLAGHIYASVGYTSEKIHLFLAFDLEAIGQALEFDETIETVRVPLAEIEGRLEANEFPDAKTVVALHRLLTYLEMRRHL